MVKETVTISLDTYKHMEAKIKNLEQGIEDLKANKEAVRWQEGIGFHYGYWFYNPSKISLDLIEAMNKISSENEKLRDLLKKSSPNAFFKFFNW